jgi:hypothetical protein
MRALVVGFVLLYAHVAAADDVQLEIHGDCALAGLDAEISQLAVTKSAALHIRIDVAREGDKLVAHVSFSDDAERTVTAATCDELFNALGLVIAMALPEAERPAPVHSEPEPVPVRAEPMQVTKQLASEPRRAAMLDAYASGGSSVSSHGPRGLVLLGVRVRRNAASLSLQLRADAPEERAVTTHASIRVLRSELSLGPCWHRGAFAGCAALTLGALRGEGIGLRAAEIAYAPLAASALRVVWEQPLGAGISLRAALEAQVLATSAQFEVDFMPVWTSHRIEASGGLGLVARFL